MLVAKLRPQQDSGGSRRPGVATDARRRSRVRTERVRDTSSASARGEGSGGGRRGPERPEETFAGFFELLKEIVGLL